MEKTNQETIEKYTDRIDQFLEGNDIPESDDKQNKKPEKNIAGESRRVKSVSQRVCDYENGRSGKGVVIALNTIAIIIYLASLILGIVLGNMHTSAAYSRSYKEEFDLATAMIYWGIGVVSGTILIAIANIIDNLNRQIMLQRALLAALLQKK